MAWVCTRLAAASDKVYQLPAPGRWFSPGTRASSTTKTGRHDIAESGIKHQKSSQIKSFCKMVNLNKHENILKINYNNAWSYYNYLDGLGLWCLMPL